MHVDDLLITGNSSSSFAIFKTYLHSCFHMKDLGPLKYILGIEIAYSSLGIYFCQQKYVLEIISEAGLFGTKSTPTPLEPNHNLAKTTGVFFPILDRYQRLVGKLIYLTLTNPKFALQSIFRHSSCALLDQNIGILLFESFVTLRVILVWVFSLGQILLLF